MLNFITEIRLKIHNFLKNNFVTIVFLIIAFVFVSLYNKSLMEQRIDFFPELNLGKYNPVLGDSNPIKSISLGKLNGNEADYRMREVINHFINLCNEDKLDEAYNMIDEDCKNYEFINKQEFLGYIKSIFYNKQKCELQLYAQRGNKYIYQVKLFEDFLKTGLTDKKFSYYDTKITIKDRPKKEDIKISIRNFIDKVAMSGMAENENIRIDVLNKIDKLQTVSYEIEVVNKREEYLVMQYPNANINPIAVLYYNGETRGDINVSSKAVLKPFEKKKIKVEFKRIYRPEKEATEIMFPNMIYLKSFVDSEYESATEENFRPENIVKTISINVGFSVK